MPVASETATIPSRQQHADFLPLPEYRPKTLYASLNPANAKLVLMAYFIAMLLLTALALSPFRNDFTTQTTPVAYSDISLYLDYARHVREGMGYYEAAKLELTANGYPTASTFNWRTPLPMWLVGQLPESQQGRWLIAPFAILLAVLMLIIVSREDEGGCGLAVLSTLLVLSSVGQVFSETTYILPVNWGAIFIGLSICCYAWNRTWAAIAVGILAAVFRELAIGYCLTMAVYAIYHRRWKEPAGWCAGFCVFAAFLGWHIWMVKQTMGESVPKPATSWLTCGGPVFLLATAQIHVYLLNVPQWVTAICLATSWLGLAGWKTPIGRRVLVVVAAYQFVFLFVGQSFNQYWGILISPLLALGFAWGLVSIRELVSACVADKVDRKIPAAA